MQLKNINEQFKPAVNVKVESEALMSHKVSRGTLQGSKKTWIKKTIKDPEIARIEILGQEFFRLITPHQPETRLLSNSKGKSYILSEEVAGYRPLPTINSDKFSEGVYTGLGQSLITAVFLQETDLKNGNIGIDNQGRVIKIDGDWCFSEGRCYGNYQITPAMIEALPYPVDFPAFNWLDFIQEDIKYINSKIVDYSLTNSEVFRREINQAMLKICLMPDSFIMKFVTTYHPGKQKYYIDLLISRRDKLLESAAVNLSFQEYVKSTQAQKDIKDFQAHMSSFTANGDTPIVPPNPMEQNELKRDLMLRFNEIKVQSDPNILKLRIRNRDLLAQIVYLLANRGAKVSDIRLYEQKIQALTSKANSEEKQVEINCELNVLLTSLEFANNDEVMEILNRSMQPQDAELTEKNLAYINFNLIVSIYKKNFETKDTLLRTRLENIRLERAQNISST